MTRRSSTCPAYGPLGTRAEGREKSQGHSASIRNASDVGFPFLGALLLLISAILYLNCDARGTVFAVNDAELGAVDYSDTGAYLTERLRRSSPQTYERELERSKKASRRQGFVLGAVAASVVFGLGLVALVYFSPETAEDLIARLS